MTWSPTSLPQPPKTARRRTRPPAPRCPDAPRALDEVVGQQHLLKPGSPLRRLVEGSGGPAGASSVILWGPPGTGKTTLAYVVSKATNKRFVELSAITAGVKEVRAVIESARRASGGFGKETVLFLDEIHRFSKAQQDSLLPAVENRWVTLIAATTENPYFSVISPLLSRSLLLTLEPLTDDDLRDLVRRALTDERGLGGALTLPEDAEAHLLRIAGGDARRVLTALEAAAGAALATHEAEITLETVEATVDRAAVKYDRDGDQHYDVASALIKSIRGSDVDAALHYLARMIEAGEDPRFIARRLMISASEDIGLADPTALPTAVAAAQAVAMIGFPEAALTLSHATIALALAPKSNAATLAIFAAQEDVRKGLAGPSRPICATAITRARPSSAMPRAISIRMTSRAVSPPSSTPRTRSATGSTTPPPGTAPRRDTRKWSSGSASAWAARAAARTRRPEPPGSRPQPTSRPGPPGARSGRGRLEERVHRPAQLGDVPYGLRKLEARVEARPLVLHEADPQPEAVQGHGHGGRPVRGVGAGRALPEQRAQRAHLVLVGGVQMLEQLRLVAGQRIGGGVPEVLRLNVLGAPEVVHVRLAELQAQHHPAGLRDAGYGGEPAGDPGPAPDAVRHGDRGDVRDLQHGRQLVALRVGRGPHGRGIRGEFEEQIALRTHAPRVRHQGFGAGQIEPRYDEQRGAGTLYESSCALGC